MPTNPGVSEVQDKNGVVADIEAKRFDGTRTVNIQGDVTASQTWNGDSSYPLTLNASIGAKKVTQDKIGDKAVGSGQMADGSVGLTQMDPNAMTSSATSGDTRLITAGGVRTEIDNAILNRGKDYGPMTPTQINAISETIPTGSTVHVTAAGTITDGDIEVRQGEDLKYYRSGNTHYWYSMDGDFKLKQQAKTSPTASGNALSFIDSITQDENGEISATKKSVQDGTTSQKGVVQLEDSISSTSTTKAATPNSVKSAYDLANGKYSKPSGGIPKSDLASDVQTSLDKADSALQPTGDGKDLTSTVETVNNYTNPGSTATALKTLFGKIWNFIGRLRTSWQTTPDDTHFPSEKLVKDSLDAKVTGPSSATAGNIAVFDGTTGKLIKDSGVAVLPSTSTWDGSSDAKVPTAKAVAQEVEKLTDGYVGVGYLSYGNASCSNAEIGSYALIASFDILSVQEINSAFLLAYLNGNSVKTGCAILEISIKKNVGVVPKLLVIDSILTTKNDIIVTQTADTVYIYCSNKEKDWFGVRIVPMYSGTWGSSTNSYKQMTLYDSQYNQTKLGTDVTVTVSYMHDASWINSGTISDNHIASASTWNGKADKVSGATNGNFAALDSNGNLTDSGKSFLPSTSTWDGASDAKVPTAKAVQAKLDGKQDSLTFMNDTEAVAIWNDAKTAAANAS